MGPTRGEIRSRALDQATTRIGLMSKQFTHSSVKQDKVLSKSSQKRSTGLFRLASPKLKTIKQREEGNPRGNEFS